jgi:tetratricopeptide (TPR) repeat protein
MWFAGSLVFTDSGSISGTVRDEAGKPLQNVALMLISHQASPASRSTTTGIQGDFHFDEVAIGEYTLRAALAGYANTESTVLIEPGSVVVNANLTLMAFAFQAQTAEKPDGPSLQLQASGLRGLIDPGGYSASANSSAATGLLKGIADVRRMGTSTEILVKDFPCVREPELLKAVEQTPNQENDRKLGEFYIVHGQLDKGIVYLTEAWRIDPTDYRTSSELGAALLRNAQFEDARKLFGSTLEHHDLPEVHQRLAQAEEGSGKFEQAAQEYRKAQTEQPSEDNLFGVGYELLLAGQPADALIVYREGTDKYPQSVRMRIGKGTAQFLLGRAAESIRTFLETTDMAPHDPRTYPFLAAATGASSEEQTRVTDSFRRFLELAPENAAANYFYGLALSRVVAGENAARIVSLLQTAIRIDPTLSKAHLLLANTYASRNNYLDAIPEYEAAIRLDSKLSEAHFRLAIAYKRTGRSEDSAHEQRAFQAIKNVEESMESTTSKSDLSQFISVMNTTSQHVEAAEVCAAAQR